VFVKVADSPPGELWSSLGMPARAAFVLVVSAPFVPEAETELAPPAEKMSLRSGQTSPPPARGPLAPAGAKRWVRMPTEEG
jgi:hypothetical protein